MTEQELKSKATYIEDPMLLPYRIKMDEYQYCLQKQAGSKQSTGIRWSTFGYFNTIDLCLVKMINDAVKEKNYTSLKEYTENLLTKIATLKEIKLT
jgi:hypothetical protein